MCAVACVVYGISHTGKGVGSHRGSQSLNHFVMSQIYESTNEGEKSSVLEGNQSPSSFEIIDQNV